jgi:DNA-binding NtrC family response regulator
MLSSNMEGCIINRENENKFTILIADRNPNVRAFLKREMMTEGYRVRLAKDSREVLKWVFSQAPLDLLILDPDLPDGEEVELFKQINDRIPQLPVVIHSFQGDYADYPEALITTVFVEKQGNSIEYLKKVVSETLNYV